ncbi:hypothetical protein BC829DRAFT_365216, partial [Chytridium lagenaria]
LPQIRQRPKYPKLNEKEKLSQKAGEFDGAPCPKHYEKYREPTLTSGAMVFVCRHGYYVGFHMFDSYEGQNDAFAGIYTHFETCPDILVGDNNCQTGDYCTLREFKYYENCRFIIDDFHAQTHKGCSRASHAKHYRSDPMIMSLNTSITESSNSRMGGNLRKAASYMSECHCIILIQTFVCMYNRGKLIFGMAKASKAAAKIAGLFNK